MDIEKKYRNKVVELLNVPEKVESSLYYEFNYEWLDTETDEFVSGYIGTHGYSVIDYDGCENLPNEVKQLLNEHGFNTDNLQDL